MKFLKLFSILSIFSIQASIAQTNVTITVNGTKGIQAISPYIYGKNNNLSDDTGTPTTIAEYTMIRDAGVRFTREFGGNNGTKYNWRLKLTSHPDWYNNIYTHNWDYAAEKLLDSLPGVQGMWAFQLIGYAAKTDQHNFDEWGYNHANSWSGTCQNLAGGGTANTAGGCTASVEGDTSLYLEQWTADSTVGILDHWFGNGGLGYDKEYFKYWSMDNEAEIWKDTHNDVIKTPITAEEFMQKYFEVAKKARAKYPDIKLCGPIPGAEWQWYNWNDKKISYNGKSYNWLEYFIMRCAEEETATGIRLLDVIDIHNYPTDTKDSTILQLHRLYFDKNYVYPNANGVKTTGSGNWDNSITKEYIFERCNQWLIKYMGPNHGVTFGVSEYGAKNINANITAVSYASTLGTFADNNVDFFTPWSWYPGMWETLHLFSRYGLSNRVESVSNNEHYVSAYSSINNINDSMTVILVNRSLTETKSTTVNISNFSIPNGSYQTLRLSKLPTTETFKSHSQNALQSAHIDVNSQSFPISLPPLSITAVVLTQTPIDASAINTIENTIEIYPTPCKDFCTIKSSTGIINTLELYNEFGQKIYETSPNSNIYSLDVNSFNNGVYLLQIHSNNNIIIKKIIIQK